MKRHPFKVLSLLLALFLLAACHGGDDATTPDDPTQPTDLPFSGTAAFGAVADPLKGLTIAFGTPMDAASVEDNLLLAQGAVSASVADAAVAVGAEKLSFHWNAAKDTVTIFGPLPYCEEYVLTLGAGTATAAGVARGEAQEIAFSTRANPADFDGVDCMADMVAAGEDAAGVLLGEEVVTFFGSSDPIILSGFGKDGKHWIQSKMKSLVRLNNVTAEGHAMIAGLGGTDLNPELLFWKGYVASPFAPATGSISIPDTLNVSGPRSIPDLNADGINEIAVGHDGWNAAGEFPIMMDYIINGGGSISLNSSFADVVDADLQHYQYAKGPRVQYGDFDGDGAQDLFYSFKGNLGDNLGNRWFIVYSPVVSGTLAYYVEGLPWQNYQFNDEHETMITSTTPDLGDGVVGDINGDGIDDIVAPTFTRDPDTGMEVCSVIYLLFGVSGMRDDRTLETAPMAKIGCPSESAYPRIVITEINADGYRDLLVSDSEARSNSIILGRAAWDAESEFADVVDVTFTGSAELELSMGITPLGDVNNDGYQDLVLRASDSFSGVRYDLIFLGRAFIHGARLSADSANAILSYE